MIKSIFLTFFFLGLAFEEIAEASKLGVVKDDGGDIVRCLAPNYGEVNSSGWYSLDFIATQSIDLGFVVDSVELDNLGQHQRRLQVKLDLNVPYLGESLRGFLKFYMKKPDLSVSHKGWARVFTQLKSLDDEYLDVELPANCPEANIEQAVRREPSGLYKYDYDFFRVQDSPLQASFLATHEWLWEVIKEPRADMIRKINKYLHSEQFFRKHTEKQVAATLRHLGVRKEFLPIKSDVERLKPIRERERLEDQLVREQSLEIAEKLKRTFMAKDRFNMYESTFLGVNAFVNQESIVWSHGLPLEMVDGTIAEICPDEPDKICPHKSAVIMKQAKFLTKNNWSCHAGLIVFDQIAVYENTEGQSFILESFPRLKPERIYAKNIEGKKANLYFDRDGQVGIIKAFCYDHDNGVMPISWHGGSVFDGLFLTRSYRKPTCKLGANSQIDCTPGWFSGENYY